MTPRKFCGSPDDDDDGDGGVCLSGRLAGPHYGHGEADEDDDEEEDDDGEKLA